MPKNIVDLHEFTTPVQVPVGTDPRNAASVETPFQALANRTEFLRERIQPQRTVELRLSLYEAIQHGPWTWSTPFGNYLETSDSSLGTALVWPLRGRIPTGAEIQTIQAIVDMGEAATAGMTLRVLARSFNFSTPSTLPSSTPAPLGTKTTSGLGLIDSGPVSHTVSDDEELFLMLAPRSNESPPLSPPDRAYAARVLYYVDTLQPS